MFYNLVVPSFRFLAFRVTDVTSVAFEQGLIMLVWGEAALTLAAAFLTHPVWTVLFHLSNSFSKITRLLFQQCLPYDTAGLHIANSVQSEALVSVTEWCDCV